mgnify:CR=1 FL=1
MKKLFLISLITLTFLSCQSTKAPKDLLGHWQRIINQEHPTNKGYRSITSFSLPNIITVTETIDDHIIRHSGTFLISDDELFVEINDKTYEGTFSIRKGALTITGNERIFKYRKVSP